MTEHYFSPTEPDAGAITTMEVELAGRVVSVDIAPKVFSHGRLDLGTRVLLRQAPPLPEAGTFLDLGCGWGPIALTMGLLRPNAQVWAVDVNERALALVAGTAQRLDLTRVKVARPDDVPPDARFDVIWSNPPIRIGKQALHDLLSRWLPRLTPDGVGYLVVQRNLGADSLTSWLNAELPGLRTAKFASAKGFRVLQVRRSDQR